MKFETKKLVGLSVLTAIIIVLQALAISIRFGIFNITLVLIPIVVGAALYGYKAGAWLGFVFSVVVLFTDAGAFLAISVPGTIITVILIFFAPTLMKILSGSSEDSTKSAFKFMLFDTLFEYNDDNLG